MPRVSVVMPAYNSEKYIERAIESILQQTYRDFELIIINDGSTDSTRVIIEEYIKRDKRIVVIDKENGGIVDALNDGIKIARGEYIARMDADDISLPRRFQLQVEALDKNKNIVLATGCFEVINEFDEFERLEILPTINEDLKRAMLLYNPIGHGSVMLRKDMLPIEGPYSKDVGPTEDFELWIRLSNVGKFVCLPQPLFRWRVNPEGITTTKNRIMLDATKDHTSRLWHEKKVTVFTHKQLRKRSKYYVSEYGHRGVKMKLKMLDDNCHIGIKLVKEGRIIDGLRQILNVILIGRSGLYVFIQRFKLAIR